MIALVSVAYGLAGVGAARLVAGHLAFRWWENAGYKAWDSFKRSQRPSGGQWFLAALTGLLLGVVWPTLLAVFLMRGWAVGAERDHRVKQRDERIRELEKELDLR